VEIGVVRPIEAVDRRNFIRRWSNALAPRFDLETPVRGAIRRTVRTALGQREVVMVALPATEVILYGDGPLSPNALRSTIRAQRVSITDARGEDPRSMKALRDALGSRADRYVALVDSTKTPPAGWLERMLVQLESRPNVRGVREESCALLAVSRIPFDMNPPQHEASVVRAVDRLLGPRAPAGRKLSIVMVAHARADIHRTSFEGIYGGQLDVDYHAVVSAAKPDVIALLKAHATLDVLVDESRGMAKGINTALARSTGEIVIVIGDDFYPPPGWFDIVREAFGLRPEMGMLGFSSVFVQGSQCVDLAYADIKAFKALAEQRRATMARDAKLTDGLTALDFAIDARALKSVGGFDPKLGAGRFGVEDLSLRVRRAGYEVYVADDLFLHHFEREMAEALLGDPQDEARNARIFSDKWKTRPDYVPARDAVALA
jgi:GT2 family glycosyltransferase